MWNFVWRDPLSGVVTTPGYNRATVPLVNSSLFFVQKTAHLRAINRTALAPKVTTIRRLFFGSGDAHRLDELQSYPTFAHCASRSLCTANIHSTNRSKTGRLEQFCKGNRTVKNSMLLIAASHTHVLFVRHLLVPHSRPLRLFAFCSPPVCGGGGHGTIPWGSEVLAMSNCRVSVLVHSNTFIRGGDIWLAS